MKVSSIIVSIFFVILTAGCSQVVYRVKPDSPPKMGIQEATDAVELALSLIEKIPNVERITVAEDQNTLVIKYNPTYEGWDFTARFSEISNETIKLGNRYVIFVFPLGGHYGYQTAMLSWKSEEDARLFADAVHALRQWRSPKYKRKTEVAVLPQKDIPPEPSRQIGAVHQVKGTVSDSEKVKVVQTASPVSSLAKATSAPIYRADKTPPRITITSPDVTGALKVKESRIIVAGIAESKSGIAEVTVNGIPANLDADGNFAADALLKVGKNTLYVAAIDTQGNKETNRYIIHRERSSTPAVAKLFSPASADKAPPRITITSPDPTRALTVVAKTSTVTVIGIAESGSGITEVTVNGLPAELDEKGNFSADIPLKVGHNSIVVAAVDVYRNKATKQFALHRESGRVARVKKEALAPEPGLPSAHYHALFIAVQDYDNKDISSLDYAVSDARRLRDILVSNYTFEKENTIILENPDRRAIYKTLQSLRRKLTSKDNLLIFYAGHGYWLDDMRQGFWLPRDAAGINDPSDWIPNSTVRDYLKAMKVKHLLLIADACFSGGIFKVRDAFHKRQTSVEKIYELPSRKAITSGSMKTVPDRSVFLEYLAKRLRENDERYLDAQRLFMSMRDAVINNSPTHQTPLYGAISEAGDEGGDFIFVKKQ